MRLERFYFAFILAVLVVRSATLEEYAFCDDCWCVPVAGETCPYDSMPKTNYSDVMLDHLLAINLENPLALSCDPYYDDACDTVPPLETGNVCAAEIITSGTQCPEEYSYR